MIIGICSYAGAGKTTICAEAIRNDIRFKQLNFSTPLYKMLIAMGVPYSMVHNKNHWDAPLDVLCGKTIRYTCQSLGTGFGRNMIGKDVWANMGIARALEMEKHGWRPIFDNVRFPNEAERIISNGGFIIAFHRDGLIPDISHESEQYIAHIQETMCAAEFINSNKRSIEENAIEFRKILHHSPRE